MQDASETEIKLVATPAMLQSLRGHADLAGPETVTRLNTAYYDTATGRLGSAAASLRIREQLNRREQTLKLAAAGGSAVRRGEWNVPLPGEALDLSLFPATVQARLHGLHNGSALEQVAVSRIERTTRRIRFGKSAIEVAFDSGVIEARGRSEDICELELELVEGSLADVLALAARLPLGPELYWSLTSKAARSLVLAFGFQETAVHAAALRLTRGCNAAKGFRAIAWNCLAHLLDNYRLAAVDAGPDAIHQCRVAIRRFRAACSVFGDVIEADAAPVLRAELKAVATRLGDVRDLDVLIARLAKAAKSAGGDATGLLSRLQDRRTAAAAPVQSLLTGAPLQVLLFGLTSWIETSARPATTGESRAGQPLPAFAARVLAKRRRKLRRRHRPISAMTVAERHALRIDVKKLRYANEFFAGLFRGKAVQQDKRRFGKALGRLQESLGELNDLAVAADCSENLFAGIEPIAAAGLEVQLAEWLKGDGKQVRRLLRSAEKSRAKLVEAPAWWKAGRGDAP